MNAVDTANAQQRAASDPACSVFTAASAGSGKTKLLTDRLLRLMLGGARPERILCLTYTKAAAAEMRLRLQKRLGEWVVLPRPALEAELRALAVVPDEKTLHLARKIFADVLDLPGGMRIETIHAFCQSLLRRFPLEAALSPHFELEDDERADAQRREAREAALARPELRDAVATLAGEIDEQAFAALCAGFCAAPEAAELLDSDLEQIIAAQADLLGATGEDEAEILARACIVPDEEALRPALRDLAARGNRKGANWAGPLLAWLGLPPAGRAQKWDGWLAGFFISGGNGAPNKLHQFFGKGLAAEEPGIRALVERECARLAPLRAALKAARLAAFNAAALRLMLPIAARERGAKTLAARLSYGDLITHTQKLLVDPGAAWVLYKLDGGIDHLLLDEVQDTAPQQWRIANAIAAEFFAGDGANARPRSIFAVGDAKQSIFSFQGADLKSFGIYREKFKALALGAERKWLDGELSVSFRSSAPVLALTDAVFAQGPAREGVYAPGEAPRHEVSRIGQAGRVSLWPLTAAQPASTLAPYAMPDDYETAASAPALLAGQIADYIAARLEHDLPARGRRARPGDFLILVRRRDALVSAMTAALKGRGIAVAGLDRMVLTAQLAIADLLALCDALLLPGNDLAFAQFLASPLGGLSDESLMRLCLGRTAALAATLAAREAEQADWAAAWAFFTPLREKADFVSPHALLAEALGPLGGRAKLLRRLGVEAAEPLDELLAEALAFAEQEPGALLGFVQKMRLMSSSIKRESESGGDEVRIMTVHGAKGLQAPIVILPDTTSLPDTDKTLFWLGAPNGARVPLFCPRASLRGAVLDAAAEAEAAAIRAEYNRLLYVALTRAEDELLVCGAQGRRALPEGSWYEAAARGFALLGARDEAGVLVHDCAQEAAPDRAVRTSPQVSAALPRWAGAPPLWTAVPPEKEFLRPERIVPSRAADDAPRRALAASPLRPAPAQGRTREGALARGVIIHALLQHLPTLPEGERAAAARAYLARQAPAIAAQAQDLCARVLAVLNSPALAPLFGPGSMAEVPLAGIAGEREIGGIIDRLAVGEEDIWLADYKSDRDPPAAHDGIPEKYIAQLAAYGSILRQIYPAREIRALLIWTETAAVMEVPAGRLRTAAPA